MPLDDEYGSQIHSSNADLQNVSIILFFPSVSFDDYAIDISTLALFPILNYRPVEDQQGAALPLFS